MQGKINAQCVGPIRVIRGMGAFISVGEIPIKFSAAAAQMMQNPAALELRWMQMISEVGAENNSTMVLMIPSDFVSLAQTLNQFLQQPGKNASSDAGSSRAGSTVYAASE